MLDIFFGSINPKIPNSHLCYARPLVVDDTHNKGSASGYKAEMLNAQSPPRTRLRSEALGRKEE